MTPEEASKKLDLAVASLEVEVRKMVRQRKINCIIFTLLMGFAGYFLTKFFLDFL